MKLTSDERLNLLKINAPIIYNKLVASSLRQKETLQQELADLREKYRASYRENNPEKCESLKRRAAVVQSKLDTLDTS